MYKFYPYFTNDGSVGLFSPDADDIYHSTYGAFTEAYEKFILPANLKKYFEKNNKIKILDICFGIGYNTKSFLNFYKENFLQNIYIETKHSDNICDELKYDVSIHGDKKLDINSSINVPQKEIFIKAIDTDKILAYLSPFFTTKSTNKNKLNFEHEKISKLLTAKTKIKYKLKKEVNIILLDKIIENHPDILNDEDIIEILNSKQYNQYFASDIVRLFNFYRFNTSNNTSNRSLSTFLHNIYYNHISNSYKNAKKAIKNNEINFSLQIEDARKALINDNNVYNYIFLDAFTPSKCPCLWTVDFFRLLNKHLDQNGMILTYSNSANIRNAFIKAGFSIGKIFNQSSIKFMGTVAVKNIELIKNSLSEKEYGLLQTKAGIVYRDKNLNSENEEIINRHKLDVQNSNLITSSKYLKSFKL